MRIVSLTDASFSVYAHERNTRSDRETVTVITSLVHQAGPTDGEALYGAFNTMNWLENTTVSLI